MIDILKLPCVDTEIWFEPSKPVISLYYTRSRNDLACKKIDRLFFSEWQEAPSDISDFEEQVLDKVKEDFLSLIEYPISEKIVKLTVLAYLLFLANPASPPFFPEAETSVEIAFEEENEVIRGRIDVLI